MPPVRPCVDKEHGLESSAFGTDFWGSRRILPDDPGQQARDWLLLWKLGDTEPSAPEKGLV